MDPQKLYDERAKLVGEIRALLESAGDKPLSAEQREQHEKMEARYDELTGQITQAERQREREAEEKRLLQPRTAPFEPPEVPTDETRDQKRATEAVNRAFENWIRTGEQRDLRQELRATTDPQTVGTVGDGGYTVPDEWYRNFIQTRKAANIMRPLATVISSSSGTMNVVKEDTEGAASWYSESAAIAVAKETVTRVQFSAYKAGRIIQVTNELLNDSMFDIAGYVTGKLARSIGVLEEAGFVSGDGSSKPGGIFSEATTGVTAASATAITADELIELMHQVSQEYRRDASWLMADATALLIRQLKDGNQQYLWQPGLQAGQPDRLLGRPVYTTSNAPAATSGLDAVLFGWVGAYYIVDRVGLAIQRLDELYAVNDYVGFKGTSRTDGGLVDTSAVRVLTMG